MDDDGEDDEPVKQVEPVVVPTMTPHQHQAQPQPQHQELPPQSQTQQQHLSMQQQQHQPETMTGQPFDIYAYTPSPSSSTYMPFSRDYAHFNTPLPTSTVHQQRPIVPPPPHAAYFKRPHLQHAHTTGSPYAYSQHHSPMYPSQQHVAPATTYFPRFYQQHGQYPQQQQQQSPSFASTSQQQVYPWPDPGPR